MSALLASVHYLNGIWINNSGKTLGLQYIHLNSGSHKNEFMYHRYYFGTRFAVAIVHSWYRLFSTVIQTTDSLSEILRLDCCENLLPCAKITSLSRRSKTRQFVASESVRRLCELDYHEQFAVNFCPIFSISKTYRRYKTLFSSINCQMIQSFSFNFLCNHGIVTIPSFSFVKRSDIKTWSRIQAVPTFLQI